MSKILVFKSLSIAPRCSGTFSCTPISGDVFRTSRLVVPDSIASHFLVTDLRIAHDSQFISVGALPAELFAKSGPCFDLQLDDLREGEEAVVQVQSTSDDPVVFGCWMRGDRLEGSKKVLLGYGSTQVGPKSSALVSVEPQCSFKPTHLFLPSSTARYFEIEEVRQSQYGTSADRSLVRVEIDEPEKQGRAAKADLKKFTYYPGGGLLVELRLSPVEVVKPGRFLTISTTNRDREQRSFMAAILGDRTELKEGDA